MEVGLSMRPWPRAVGYQPPQVEYHQIDVETVSRVSANDPGIVAGLQLFAYQVTKVDDADKVGRAISRSIHLRTLIIRADMGDMYGCHFFFIWLAQNRSIEHLEFYGLHFSEIDIFRILTPFFEHNFNLRCIELIWSKNMSNRISSLILALSNLETSRLEKNNLRHSKIGDTEAADLQGCTTY